MQSYNAILDNLLSTERKVSIVRLQEMINHAYNEYDEINREAFIKDLLNLKPDEQQYVLDKQKTKGYALLDLKIALGLKSKKPDYKNNADLEHLQMAIQQLMSPPTIAQPQVLFARNLSGYEDSLAVQDWEAALSAQQGIEAQEKQLCKSIFGPDAEEIFGDFDYSQNRGVSADDDYDDPTYLANLKRRG